MEVETRIWVEGPGPGRSVLEIRVTEFTIKGGGSQGRARGVRAVKGMNSGVAGYR